MRITTLLAVSLAILALAYAALDDITTGRQPSFVLEWVMVAVALVWFAAMPVLWRRRRRWGAAMTE